MARTLYKAAGVTVFSDRQNPSAKNVLAELLRAEPWRGEMSWSPGFEGGIAHRLDRHTSGALLVADSEEELRHIRSLFAHGAFCKTYRMLAAKEVSWNDNQCERPIAHCRRRKGRMIVQRGERTPHRGRWYPAHTEVKRLSGRLWEVKMRTGVMHQIRVHSAFLGIPIEGDRLYGGAKSAHPDAPQGFLLHHVGMRTECGVATSAVPMPDWADVNRGLQQ